MAQSSAGVETQSASSDWDIRNLAFGLVRCGPGSPLSISAQGARRCGSLAATITPALCLIAVASSAGVTTVTVSSGSHYACAVLDDGTVKCWGTNQFGQLGLGDRRNRGYVLSEMGESLPAVNLR